jgi:ABC-type nitrate/sulfonate/bicarbonate transport system substrate-binding protein
MAVLLGLLACGPGAGPAPGAAGAVSSSNTIVDRAGAAVASPPGDTGSAAPTEAPAGPARKVEMPLATVSATNAPLWVAIDQGIFAQYGLEVLPEPMAAATASQALSTGNAPAAITGGSSVSAWVGGARNLVFIAGLMNRATFQVLGAPDVTTVEGLRGGAVGASTPGSTASLALIESLRRYGLEVDRDWGIIYLREDPARVAALASGAVQGVVLNTPFTEQVLAQGGNLLVDMRPLDIEMLSLNVATTREQIDQDPDLLRRLVMGYVEGVQFARDNPEPTIAAIMRGTRTDNRADAENAYLVNRDAWSPRISERGVQAILEATDHPDAKSARPSDLIDDRFMRDLEASGWLTAHYHGP